MQVIIGTLCNVKAKTSKHDTFSPTYKEMKKIISSTNNVEHKFWFCYDDIKRCVNGNQNEYVMANEIMNQYLKDDVLALEDTMFQLQQREGHVALL